MDNQTIAATILKFFFLITSPVTFLVGVFLIFDIDTYMRIEQFLGRSITIPRKKLIKELNKHREFMQMFLVRRRKTIGFICLLNSLAALIFTSVVLMKK